MINAATLPPHEEAILWAHVLNCEWKQLLAGSAPDPSPEQSHLFDELAARRAGGEPLQYLTGVQGFRRLHLEVGPGVLVPRPETEMVVERVLELVKDVPSPRVLDVGTGSGAIALAVATERPDSEVWAVESSPEALVWARRNIARVGAPNVGLLTGSFFDPLPGKLHGCFDLVVSNPPYLSAKDLCDTQPDVRHHEPAQATVAGPCGLEAYRRLVEESVEWLRPGGVLILETWEGQWGRLRSLLCARFTDVAITSDLAGKLRIAEGRKP